MANTAPARSALCHQVAALPWRREDDGSISVLLITSRTNGKWMLPKGWPMKGLSEADSARQEALEEAGVEGRVDAQAVGSYRYSKLFSDGSSTPGQAVIFPLEVTRERKDWKEKGQRQRRWMSPNEAAEAAHEPDLSRFLANLAAGRVTLSQMGQPRAIAL
ncbi:NUDIX hydrolase [Devosia riboflavina]|uniref:NUDIX hydrolase n=1 Tax=Devosia riboflavina TaxID=46914 RepID=UPI00068CC080|nr:NUDIX hydrolase [Devosia riboflavina]